MGVRAETFKLAAMELVEMFVFDDGNIGGTHSGANALRWHSGTTPANRLPIRWQGYNYEPFPIEATGFDLQSAGKLPRPTLRCSNIGGALGAYIRTLQDALGAKIIRKRTLGKYLDAANFAGGNPTADPSTYFPDEIYFVARKAHEDAVFIEMELCVPFDVQSVMLPRRQVIAGTCQWVYRSAGCSYTGPAVQDINGLPTSDPNKDQCRKTLDACRARFGAGNLRTSAFPASMLARYSS
jgi:lambda family phage minor tail protein L